MVQAVRRGRRARHDPDTEDADVGMTAAEGRALHERLVWHVAGAGAGTGAGAWEGRGRCGVWVEHSYARAGDGAAPAPRPHPPHLRLLLDPAPPPAPPATAIIDVGDEAPCEPADEESLAADEEEPDEAWTSRACAAAGGGARVVRAVRRGAELLRELCLARRAAPRAPPHTRLHQARRAARRLRLALAEVWCVGGARLGASVVAALRAHAPPAARALLHDMLSALPMPLLPPPAAAPAAVAETAPPAPPAPAAAPDLLRPDIGPAVSVSGSTGPVVVWVECVSGGARGRWARRLGALLPLLPLRCPAPTPAAPEQYCGAIMSAARADLAAILADVGSRGVIVGGFAADAALAAALCAGAGGQGGAAGGQGGVRGLVVLAPPLLSAEGGPDTADDMLHDIRVPVLIVCGANSASCGRAAALQAAECGAGAAGARRVVVVGGAGGALRPGPAHAHVPPHALDAAVLEEVVRWVEDVAVISGTDPPSSELDDEQYCSPPRAALTGTRNMDIAESCVVTRVSGRTPLALVPPRREAPAPLTPGPPVAPVPPRLGAADILQLPIVFADDDPAAPTPATPPPLTPVSLRSADVLVSDNPLTVRSGAGGARGTSALKYTRVIVAKRAAPGAPTRPAAAPGAPARLSPAPGARQSPGTPAARPLLMRRTLRVVPRKQ